MGQIIESFGGFVIWFCKFFKGGYLNSRNHSYSYIVGFGSILLIILILIRIID